MYLLNKVSIQNIRFYSMDSKQVPLTVFISILSLFYNIDSLTPTNTLKELVIQLNVDDLKIVLDFWILNYITRNRLVICRLTCTPLLLYRTTCKISFLRTIRSTTTYPILLSSICFVLFNELICRFFDILLVHLDCGCLLIYIIWVCSDIRSYLISSNFKIFFLYNSF